MSDAKSMAAAAIKQPSVDESIAPPLDNKLATHWEGFQYLLVDDIVKL